MVRVEIRDRGRGPPSFCWGGGGGDRPTPPSLASVMHTFEAVAGSGYPGQLGISYCDSVSAPGSDGWSPRVQTEAERNKIANKYR